jgi:hypothetical protein
MILVRFKRDAIVERAHLDPGKGGFRHEIIPAGTIKKINYPSLRFWQDRGDFVEVLPEPESEQIETTEDKTTKASVRRAVERIRSAIRESDFTAALVGLKEITSEPALNLVPELSSDSRMLLVAARDDLEDSGSLDVNEIELEEALTDVEQLLLPPSRRRK